MKLVKAVSHTSNHSRREAKELILQGKVAVNKNIVKIPAFLVQETDIISLEGKILKPKDEYTVLIYNKQRAELVTKNDDRNRKTIFHSLPSRFKGFISVGRLDFLSTGLIILTDNKSLAHNLETSDLIREYNLKLSSALTEEMQKAMQEGMFLEDARKGGHEKSKIVSMDFKPFVSFKILNEQKTRIRVAITQGHNRELRRFFAHFNAEILDLNRISFGVFSLDGLKNGSWRFLRKDEYKTLRQMLKEKP